VLVLAYPVYPGSEKVRKSDRVPTATARTAGDGSFRVDGLGLGPVVLSFRTPAGYRAPDEVEVQPGREGLDFVLERTVDVTVRLLDDFGGRLPGAAVWLYSRKTVPRTHLRAVAGADGTVFLADLVPDLAYYLTATPPPDRPELAPRRLNENGWTPRDTVLRFRSGQTTSGRVLDLDGEPYEGAWVTRKDERGNWVHVGYADREGRFTVEAMDPGPLVLRALAPDKTEGEPVETRVGAKDVELRIERALELRIVTRNWRKEYRGNATVSVLNGKGGVYWVAGDGVSVARGIRPGGPASLCVRVRDSDLIAYVPDLDVRAGEIAVELVPGEMMSGRVRLPERAVGGRVRVRGRGFVASADVRPDGTFEIRQLPRGTWDVLAEWYGKEDEEYGRTTTKAATGSFVELNFPEK
jgi:hypothetical protein